MEQAKAIESIQITITDVSGSSVTSQMVAQFKNGTQQTSTGIIDVATGIGNMTTFLIASNLSPNDQIYIGNDDQKINETITSGSKQLNHQSIIMEYNVTQEELASFNIPGPLHQTNSQDTYWNKQTGALTQMTYKMATRSEQVNADISVNVELDDPTSSQPTSTPTTTPTITSTLTATPTTVPEYTIPIILIGLVASTFAAIKLHKQKLF